MLVSNDIKYVGVNDHDIDLFEGQYKVLNGMSYNSYVICDEKTAVMDTVDARFTHQWLDQVSLALDGRQADYLIIHHMEPDHSANIVQFMNAYPNAVIVASSKAFKMIEQFFGNGFEDRRMVVEEGNTLSLGKHTLTFLTAPMVHWPEVIVSYDDVEQILFSADAFGKFGALDVEEEWDCEARRYYFGIVGKYGMQVQALLKKLSKFEIKMICSLHGPVLNENIDRYLNLYNIWSSYEVESEGIVIAYTSIYGNTKNAVNKLSDNLRANGCPKVVIYDLARCDMAEAVEDAFRYGKLVLATTTYNADVFPFMREFINHLTERNYQNRTIGIIENGSWAPMAEKIIKEMFAKSKNLTFAQNTVHILGALNEESNATLIELSNELCKDITQSNDIMNKNDLTALFKIGYGLYVVTSNNGKQDNGLIVNTVTQVTDSPTRVAVTVSKQNYSHHVIKQTGIMNVNCLSVKAPFEVFEKYGFQSGRNIDKFKDITPARSDNGLAILTEYTNAFMSLKVEQYVDFGTHGMFICSVTESRLLSDAETMTYSYYQSNVKPKPKTEGKKGFVCKICGYVYEGDVLPEDIICPICKHGAADFEPIQ